MQGYRKSSHTTYLLHYHFVFIPKYRKPILRGDVAIRVRELVREICRTNNIEILKGHVRPEHVHLLLSVPPHLGPSRVMQAIKGKTSHHLLRDFRALRKQFWGRHLWARGNKSLTPKNLWAFAAGRGAQEKTLAELRGQFALDVVPTNDYAANNAWQQLNILAHNLCRGFQLDTIAENKPPSPKRTYMYVLHSVRTLRFLIISKAGRLVRIGGRNVLRMSRNSDTQRLFEDLELALAS